MSSKGWRKKQLGDLVTFQRGHDLSKPEFIPGNYPIAGSNGIIGYHNTFTTKGPSITLGRSGNLGTPYFYKDDFWAHNTTLYVKEFHNSDPKFVYYLLKTLDFSQFNSGSAVPSLNRNYIHPIEVYVPEDLETQRRIADILSALDEKIELNRQANATLEAIARAIFREWFVEFNFAEVSELAESEFGMIPKGWRVGKLGEVIEVKGGTTPSTKEEKYWNGEYYFATPKDLSNLNSPILLDTERKITKEGVSQISSGILPEGTLLLSSRAPIGYLALSNIPISINQGFIAINAKELSNLFILHWLRENMETVISRANGSTFLEITKTNFKQIELVIPDSAIANRFEKIISPIFEQIKINEQQSATLTSLRNVLLPKLMNGEIGT